MRALVAVLCVVCLSPVTSAQAQQTAPAQATQPVPPPQPNFETRQNPPLTPGADAAANPPPASNPTAQTPPPPPNFETRQNPPLTPGPDAVPLRPGPPPVVVAVDPDLTLDGHLRYGPFLAGPGSLTFILHHTLMGAAGGFATQAIPHHFSLEAGSREGMLAGLLIGAGVGFGTSAWWQFNHWIGQPMSNFGIAASAITGMFATGLMDLVSNDPSLLTWTAFAGAELGAWLTLAAAGGDMPTSSAVTIGSGAGWGLLYGGLLLAILTTSGNRFSAESITDFLLISPGLGAGFLALTLLKLQPSTSQVLRADLFGGAVGAGVLLLSGLILGRFDVATPYILSLLSSVAAIGAVSLLWEEKAEHPPEFRPVARDDRYRSVWW